MTAEPLKPLPCPWCKTIPSAEYLRSDFSRAYFRGTDKREFIRPAYFICPSCGCKGPDAWITSDTALESSTTDDEKHAIAAWNRRAEPEELPEWVKLIIMRRISHLQESVDATEYDDNKYAWNFAIEELEDILSLKKGDS